MSFDLPIARSPKGPLGGALVAAALATALLIWWLWPQGRVAPQLVFGPSAATTAERPAQIAELAASPGARSASPSMVQGPALELERTPLTDRKASMPAGLLRGRVRLEDTQGAPLPDQNGRLSALVPNNEGPSKLHEFEVQAGVFEGAWIQTSAVRVVRWTFIESGDQPRRYLPCMAHKGSPGACPASAGGAGLELLFTEQPVALLRVLDASSKRPCSGVLLAPADSAAELNFLAPGEGSPAPLQLGASPIEVPQPLELGLGPKHYFVGAPGYGFEVVPINHALGGMHAVSLARGGSLVLDLVGWPNETTPSKAGASPWHVLLTFDGPEGQQTGMRRQSWLVPESGQGLSIPALPAGQYRIAVVSAARDRFHPGYPMGSKFQLGAGEAKRYALEPAEDLLRRVKSPAIPFEGTIHIPASWQRLVGSTTLESPISLLHVDPSSPGPGQGFRLRTEEAGNGALKFSAKVPRPGTYWLQWPDLTFERRFEVPPEGLVGIELELPAPAQLEVVVRDPRTGNSVQLLSLHFEAWGPGERPNLRNGMGFRFDSAALVHRATCTAGELLIESPDFSDRRIEPTPWTVVPGLNRIELTLIEARNLFLELSFPDGGAQQVQGIQLLRSEGAGARGVFHKHPGRYSFQLFRGGPVRLEFPVLPGFEPTPPLEVELPADNWPTLQAEYRRLR
jgi:hypothetical protein